MDQRLFMNPMDLQITRSRKTMGFLIALEFHTSWIVWR